MHRFRITDCASAPQLCIFLSRDCDRILEGQGADDKPLLLQVKNLPLGILHKTNVTLTTAWSSVHVPDDGSK